jgi:hypothetical protein
MTAPAPLITATELADYLAGEAEAIVEQVQAAIRSYCGWHIAGTLTESVILDGHGSSHLWLPSLHVTAVEEVTDSETDLTTDDYDWSAIGYLERRGAYWSTRPRQIEVTFTHGYPVVPPEVIGVAAAIAARAVASPTGATDESAGAVRIAHATFGGGVSGGIALLEHERQILDRYKLPPRI